MKGENMFKDKIVEITRLYLEEKKPLREIAKLVGSSRSTITRYFKKMNIPVRKRSDYPSLYDRKGGNYKGGKRTDSHGYVGLWIPQHHRATRVGYVSEHIFVWEKINNRKLPKGWIIHHLNGIRNDNRPENLMALKKSEHTRLNENYKKRIRELELENSRLRQLNFITKGEVIWS